MNQQRHHHLWKVPDAPPGDLPSVATLAEKHDARRRRSRQRRIAMATAASIGIAGWAIMASKRGLDESLGTPVAERIAEDTTPVTPSSIDDEDGSPYRVLASVVCPEPIFEPVDEEGLVWRVVGWAQRVETVPIEGRLLTEQQRQQATQVLVRGDVNRDLSF